MTHRFQSIRATLMRPMGRPALFLLAFSLIGPNDLRADGIKPRAWALQSFDKSIEVARKSINDPRTLDTLLEVDFTNVIDHPEVFKLLETIVQSSTSPACVRLALQNLAYKYYNLESYIDKTPKISGAHSKQTRRQNTLRLLTHALNHQDLWVQKHAATILMHSNVKDLDGKRLAYPVVLRLASAKDWEKRVEKDAELTRRDGSPQADSLKQAWAGSLTGALMQYDTREAGQILRDAWRENRFEFFVKQHLLAETVKPNPYAPTVEGLQKLIHDVQRRLAQEEKMTP